MKKKITNIIIYAFFPLMASIYPSVFHYANNASILVVSSFLRMAFLNTVIAIMLYIIILIIHKYQAPETASGTFMLLVFFNTYGLLYNYLIALDIFRVEHYTLLPLYMLVGIYASWLITKIPGTFATDFIKTAALILSALVIFNLSKITSVEIAKDGRVNVNPSASMPVTTDMDPNTDRQYPDIY